MKNFSYRRMLAFCLSAAMIAGSVPGSTALAEDFTGEAFLEEAFSDGGAVPGETDGTALEEAVPEEIFSGVEELETEGFASEESDSAEVEAYEAAGESQNQDGKSLSTAWDFGNAEDNPEVTKTVSLPAYGYVYFKYTLIESVGIDVIVSGAEVVLERSEYPEDEGWMPWEESDENIYSMEAYYDNICYYRVKSKQDTDTEVTLTVKRHSLHVDSSGDFYTNVTGILGQQAEIKVNATSTLGADKIQYQWQKLPEDGGWQNIAGAVNASYVTETLTDDIDRYYQCVVSDGQYTKTAKFYLEVSAGLKTVGYASVDVWVGDKVTLDTEAASTQPITYKWSEMDEDSGLYTEIAGATGKTYSFTVSKDTPTYFICDVYDGYTSKTVYFELMVHAATEKKPEKLELAPDQKSWMVYDSDDYGIPLEPWDEDYEKELKVTYTDGTEKYIHSMYDVKYGGALDENGDWMEGMQKIVYSYLNVSVERPIFIVRMDRNVIALTEDVKENNQSAEGTAPEYKYYGFKAPSEGFYEFNFSSVSGSGIAELYKAGSYGWARVTKLIAYDRKMTAELEANATYLLAVKSAGEGTFQYDLTASKLNQNLEVDQSYRVEDGGTYFFTPDRDGFYQIAADKAGASIYDGETCIGSFTTSYSLFLRAGKTYRFELYGYDSESFFKLSFSETASFDESIEVAVKYEGIMATLSDKGALNYTGTGELNLVLALWDKDITSVVIGEGITTTGEGSLFSRQENLTSVELPSTLKKISWYTFFGCTNLSDIRIPNISGLEEIGRDAFYGTPFMETLEKSGSFSMLGDIAVTYQGTEEDVTIPENTRILADEAMKGAASLKNLTILQKLKKLGQYSLSECSALTEVRVPGNVTSIGYGTFASDTALESVVLEDGIEEIDCRAFYHCDSLKSITIPKSVKSIGAHAIGYKEREYVEGSGYIDKKNDQLPLIKCYSGSAAYEYAIKNEIPYELLDEPTPTTAPTPTPTTAPIPTPVPATPTPAPSNPGTITPAPATPTPTPAAVKKGTKFTSGNYKYQVTGTNTVAFIGLKKAKTSKVSIGTTVKYQGRTFNITSVGKKALYKNAYVTQITVGNKVTSIGDYAFAGCKKLKKVTLGTAVKTIGKYAMKSSTKLSSVTIKSTKLKTVKSGAFKSIYSKATIKVPSKKLSAYKKLLKNKGLSSKAKIKK